MPKGAIRQDQHPLWRLPQRFGQFGDKHAYQCACIAATKCVRCHIDDGKINRAGHGTQSALAVDVREMRRQKKRKSRTSRGRAQ
jgi:hypothetical protein